MTAPAKSKATVDLASVPLLGFGPTGPPFAVACTPLAGQRTRLATIRVLPNPAT